MSEPYYDPYLPRKGSRGEPVPAGPNSRYGSPSAGPSQEDGGKPPAAGPSEVKPNSGDSKTAQVQAQIDDTVGIMRENITKVAERGERLEDLGDKADNLATSAQGFRRGANRVRKNMWWKDMKMRIIIGTAITVILIIIIVSVVKATQGHN